MQFPNESKVQLFENRFRQILAKGRKEWYDEKTSNAHLIMWAHLLDQLQLEPGKSIEFGCGTGSLCSLLEEGGWTATGIDCSQTALQIARKKHPNVEFEHFDLQTPIPTHHQDKYDLVIDGNCYHFMVGDCRLTYLNNIHYCLNNTGLLLMHVHVGQPGEENRSRLDYNPETRTSSMDGFQMNYYAELEELLTELRSSHLVPSHVQMIKAENADTALILASKVG